MSSTGPGDDGDGEIPTIDWEWGNIGMDDSTLDRAVAGEIIDPAGEEE